MVFPLAVPESLIWARSHNKKTLRQEGHFNWGVRLTLLEKWLADCWHCETPLYSAGGQIFILRALIRGTRRVKGKARCAISVASHSCAKDAQEWGTPGAGCAGG